MIKFAKPSTALVGVSLIALLSSAPALAQAADGADDNTDIVVTAQKREQTLLEVPLAIQAISGAELEESGTSELNDLIESIPGASSVSRTAPGFETIQIRGIASGTTGDATVGYYVDDVPFSVPNLQLAPPARLFDLQRVEILRGPQGTLYGQGAMGGTIRMITASPVYDDIIGRFQGEISDYSGGAPGFAADGVLNLPIVTDSVALRVSGGYELVGGFSDALVTGAATRRNANETRSWNVRGKLGIQAADNVNIELGAWRVVNNLDYRNTMDTPETFTDTTGPVDRPNYVRTTLSLYSGVVRADLGGAELTSSTSYIDSVLDFDASFLPGGILRNDSTFRTKAFTQEIRLASTGGGPFNWLIGGYYSDGNIQSDICLSLFVPCTVPFSININSTGRISTRAWALFGEASYSFFDDRLTATVGGREFRDRRRTRGVNRNGNIITTDGDVFTSFNPRFNLSFQASDDFLFYGNIAKGFRSGSFQTQPQADAASLALGTTVPTAIQPDSVWSYEVGAKGNLFGRLVQIDAAIYTIDWTNIQLQSTLNGVATLTNGGNARSRGIDLGITLRPARGLSFTAVGNINETEFQSVLPQIVAVNPLAAAGQRIPGVPESSLQLTAGYRWDFANWTGANGFVTGGYTFRNSQLDSTGLSSDRLNEFNVRAGIGRDNWRIQIFGENLTNTRVALTRGSLGIQPNAPRKIGMRFNVDF